MVKKKDDDEKPKPPQLTVIEMRERITAIDGEVAELDKLIGKAAKELEKLKGNLKAIQAETQTSVRKNLSDSFSVKGVDAALDDILTMPIKSAKVVQLEESITKLATTIKWADDEKKRLAYEKSQLHHDITELLITEQLKEMMGLGKRFFEQFKEMEQTVSKSKQLAAQVGSLDANFPNRLNSRFTPPELQGEELVKRYVEYHRLAGTEAISALVLLDRFGRDLVLSSKQRPQVRDVPIQRGEHD